MQGSDGRTLGSESNVHHQRRSLQFGAPGSEWAGVSGCGSELGCGPGNSGSAWGLPGCASANKNQKFYLNTFCPTRDANH